MRAYLASLAIAGLVMIGSPIAASAMAGTAAQRCAGNAENGDVPSCRQAVRDDPGDLASRRNLAHSLALVSDFMAAIQIYRAIAAERPNDPRAHYDLAGLLGAIRLFEDAVAPIEHVLRLQPDNILAHQAAAVIYAQVGRMKDSVAVTLRAAEKGDSTSMYEMSLFYQDGRVVKTDPDKAFHWARQAAEQNHVAAMQFMSEIYLEGLFGQTPNTEKAIEWARRSREISGGISEK